MLPYPSLRALLAGITLLCAAACGPADKAAETAPSPLSAEAAQIESDMTQTGPTVVMLGDSLTAGYQLPLNAALPAAVERALKEEGVSARVINAGVSGDTTADGLARYDFSVADVKPDLLVVALGANDFLNGFPPETAKKNLSAIIERAKKDDLTVALMGIVVPEGSSATNDREAEFAAIYPELAGKYELPLLPNMLAAVSGQSNLLQSDGLHPTSEGVELMADDIAGFLAPLVAELTVDP